MSFHKHSESTSISLEGVTDTLSAENEKVWYLNQAEYFQYSFVKKFLFYCSVFPVFPWYFDRAYLVPEWTYNFQTPAF